jgi:protein SCO1
MKRGLILLSAAALAAACLACQPEPQLDDFGRAPQFNLTDQNGAAFSSASLAGHATLLDFIYTHCTDACPLLSATFQDTGRKLADQNLLGNKVMLVSVSVDPTHDTPAVLNEYGQQFKADPASWKFLTGDWDDVWDVVTGFKVATRPPRPAVDAPAPGGTELTHTTRIVLLDPQLEARAYLEGDGATADDLLAAAKRALR